MIIGIEVVCLDNTPRENDWSDENTLTIGKCYTVVEHYVNDYSHLDLPTNHTEDILYQHFIDMDKKEYIKVIDNNGDLRNFFLDRFISKNKIRMDKLKQII